MFNTVWSTQTCPSCKKTLELGVQIKYGWMRMRDYRIRDRMEWEPWPERAGILQTRWHESNEGRPGLTRVVVDGLTWGRCPHCYIEDWPEPECFFTVLVEHDIVVSVSPLSKEDPYYGYGYVILDEASE